MSVTAEQAMREIEQAFITLTADGDYAKYARATESILRAWRSS